MTLSERLAQPPRGLADDHFLLFWRWCSLICPQQRAGLWETVFKVMISKTSVSEITCSSTSLPDLNPELCMSTTGPRGCMPCRR